MITGRVSDLRVEGEDCAVRVVLQYEDVTGLRENRHSEGERDGESEGNCFHRVVPPGR